MYYFQRILNYLFNECICPQILKEFHEDCQDLLRELYEDGFLMEVPDVLCDDSNSLSSSVLSTHHVSFSHHIVTVTLHYFFLADYSNNQIVERIIR